MKSFLKVSLVLLVVGLFVFASPMFAEKTEKAEKTVKKEAPCCPMAAVKDNPCCAAKAKAEKVKATKKAHDHKGHIHKAPKAHKDIECQKKTIYVCPVEKCKYKAEKAGKCPTCGKELVKKDLCCYTMYVCDACKVKAHKPGKCKCGKELVKKVKCSEKHMELYVCPMKKCNVKTHKPGKCPKCGMELKKVEMKDCCPTDKKAACCTKDAKAKKAACCPKDDKAKKACCPKAEKAKKEKK